MFQDHYFLEALTLLLFIFCTFIIVSDADPQPVPWPMFSSAGVWTTRRPDGSADAEQQWYNIRSLLCDVGAISKHLCDSLHFLSMLQGAEDNTTSKPTIRETSAMHFLNAIVWCARVKEIKIFWYNTHYRGTCKNTPDTQWDMRFTSSILKFVFLVDKKDKKGAVSSPLHSEFVKLLACGLVVNWVT